MTPTPNKNRPDRPDIRVGPERRVGQDEREKRDQNRKEITVWQATVLELRDRIRNLRMGVSIEMEDLLRGGICGALIVLFALLQTTFFVRFAPFGAVPDLLLMLTAAIAAGEGEKYGAVCGLFSAFIIESLGGAVGPHLLPLLYAAAGCAVGLLSKDYLTNSFAVKLLYVFFCCLGRAFVTVITAKAVLAASFGSIIKDIAVPEFFSTALLSPLPFFAAWICYRRFHKSREERTGL